MGSVRIPLYAAAGAVALISLCATPAGAAYPGPGGQGGPGNLTLTPAVISPGGDLDIRTQSCGRAVAGTVSSTVFVSTVKLAPAADGGLSAEAVISSGAAAGSYPVYVNCDGRQRAAEGLLTIGGGHGSQWGGGGNDHGGDHGGGNEHGGGNGGGNDHGSGGDSGKQWGGGGDSGEKQWGGGGGGGGGGEKQWGEMPSEPIAPVPAGGGGTAKLVVDDASSSAIAARQPHEAGVPAVVAAGVLAAAGIAGLALHRRRRRRDQD